MPPGRPTRWLAYLEPEASASSPCSLCRPCRRTLARPHALDSIPPSLLSSPPGAAAPLSWQVRCWSQVGLSAWSTAPFRGSVPARSASGLRFLAKTTVPKELGLPPYLDGIRVKAHVLS